MTGPDARAGYVAGLRQLADALEAHPELPLPFNGQDDHGPLIMGFYSSTAREDLAAAVRALPCTWAKDADTKWLNLNGQLGGLHVQLYAAREQVCTRRVVGTEHREVTVEVTPAVKRTEIQDVEIVEWDCHPILASCPTDVEAGAA